MAQLVELGLVGPQRALGGDAAGLVARELPVDALAGRVHGLLQLAHEARDHERVGRQPCGTRELRRVDIALAREEFAHHLAELVLRTA